MDKAIPYLVFVFMAGVFLYLRCLKAFRERLKFMSQTSATGPLNTILSSGVPEIGSGQIFYSFILKGLHKQLHDIKLNRLANFVRVLLVVNTSIVLILIYLNPGSK